MKRIARFFSRCYHQHIASWEEPPRSAAQELANVSVLRCSMGRYYKFNRPGLSCIIEYASEHEHAIDLLRNEGWTILLELDASGELFYGVYSENAVSILNGDTGNG